MQLWFLLREGSDFDVVAMFEEHLGSRRRAYNLLPGVYLILVTSSAAGGADQMLAEESLIIAEGANPLRVIFCDPVAKPKRETVSFLVRFFEDGSLS